MRAQIYYNGDILTMEDRTAQAVRVLGGRIERVGERSEILRLRTPDTEMIDLRGQTLLPAFLDPHSHLTAYADSLRYASLEGAESFEEILSRLEDFKRTNRLDDGGWIIGFGYDHNLLAERRHPGCGLLDSFENPVLLSHASGHMGAVNSEALRRAGITRETPDPAGGRIGREDSGQPNGYLEEKAFMEFPVPVPDEGQSLDLLERAQRVYAGYGIASAQEGAMHSRQFRLLDRMAREERLFLDVVGYVDLNEDRVLLLEHPEYTRGYRGRFRLGGYKIFLDGSPQGRTAWLSEPYLPQQEGYCGYPVYSDETVERFVGEACGDAQQLLAHCNGDAAAEQFLRAWAREGAQGARPVMIHAQLVRDDQLSRMKQGGIIPSFFTAHTWYWGDIHLENLGQRRASRISPARSALERGIPFTLHQDAPVIQPNVLETVWCAVNRLTKAGIPLGEGQKITPYDALKAVTVNAAYQYFEEEDKGSIKEGKKADFVLLDRNPLRVAPMEIRQIQVVRTIKEGKTIFARQPGGAL